MSHFKCTECETDIIDSPAGFLTECEHWTFEELTEAKKEYLEEMFFEKDYIG